MIIKKSKPRQKVINNVWRHFKISLKKYIFSPNYNSYIKILKYIVIIKGGCFKGTFFSNCK